MPVYKTTIKNTLCSRGSALPGYHWLMESYRFLLNHLISSVVESYTQLLPKKMVYGSTVWLGKVLLSVSKQSQSFI